MNIICAKDIILTRVNVRKTRLIPPPQKRGVAEKIAKIEYCNAWCITPLVYSPPGVL